MEGKRKRERKNSSRASNKTRENDQSFAVWAGGVGACDEERKRGKNKGGGVKLGERRTRSGVGGLGSN